MDAQVYWIENGRIAPAAARSDAGQTDEDARIHRHGLVKVTAGAKGIELKWAVCAPNWASLYFAMDWLSGAHGPFILKYHLAGWFEETIAAPAKARGRIDQIIAKSDIHLTRRTYVREANPKSRSVPAILRAAWTERMANPDISVDCVFDERAQRFRVLRIGAHSTIAKLWGLTPVSYPCINGGSYDQIVAQAYRRVLKTRRPHFDHVFAAMTAADNTHVWIPYQRVVLPHRVPGGKPAVSVVTEIAPVDIRIV